MRFMKKILSSSDRWTECTLDKQKKKKIKEKRRKKIMRKLAKWFEESLESYVKLMGNTYGWGGRL